MGASELAMGVNDNAGLKEVRDVFRCIASKLAPAEGGLAQEGQSALAGEKGQRGKMQSY
jgi:hypothetical protein